MVITTRRTAGDTMPVPNPMSMRAVIHMPKLSAMAHMATPEVETMMPMRTMAAALAADRQSETSRFGTRSPRRKPAAAMILPVIR